MGAAESNRWHCGSGSSFFLNFSNSICTGSVGALALWLFEAKHRSMHWHSELAAGSVFTGKTYMSFQVNFQFSVSRLLKLLISMSIPV